MSGWDENQVETWHRLFDAICDVLAGYGTERARGSGDYSVNEDNYGWRRITVLVHDLRMLAPEIVARLRNLLSSVPDWEIVVAVDVVGKERAWPVMGLTIRSHEIVDGLQRQYFPAQYRSLAYPDSRVGTGYE